MNLGTLHWPFSQSVSGAARGLAGGRAPEAVTGSGLVRLRAIVPSIGVAVAAALLAAACASPEVRPADASSPEMEGVREVADLHVVDCLLPGEVRRMGKATYLSPRRPVRTTARDCRLRGGEYTAYDRADRDSALGVWLEQARAGDAEAQYRVGEIHEDGMGRAPDYAQAFHWYRQAAEQGHRKAQVALGYLYEMGQGVEQDLGESLRWYRRAAGAGDNELVFADAARQRMRELEAGLQAELDGLQQERDALAEQVDRLRSELEGERESRQAQAETTETLERMLNRVESRVAETQGRLVRLRGQELPASDETGEDRSSRQFAAADVGRERFGDYHALVVGLETYMYWEDLESSHEDARIIARLLSERYGFDTTMLLDATGAEILSAINDLRERVDADDNILIYFAGHGQLLAPESSARSRGYWLPINAERQRTTWWVANSAINDYLAILDARSILVVADSCFGGALSTDPSSMLLGGDAPVSDRLIELGLSRQARYVLSSGGLHPVLDGTQGQHSVFARALIEVLEDSDQVLRAQDLFALVARRTERMASAMGVEQQPELRPIREAGHEAGSFFLVPAVN